MKDNNKLKNNKTRTVKDTMGNIKVPLNAEYAAQYLQRGRRVLVEGNVSSYKYTDDEGQERIFTSVQGQRIQYLPPQQTGNASAGNTGNNGNN